MIIAIKDTKLKAINEVEWQCRREAKGLDKSAYWTWLATVTSEDEHGTKSYDFSGEDYEIIKTDAPLSYETKDSEGNDITVTFNQSGHIHSEVDTGQHYHLKWDGSKIIPDEEGLSACKLSQEWESIRLKRNRLLAETDYLAMQDQPNMSNDMQIYRQKLRMVPQDNTNPNNIDWPARP